MASTRPINLDAWGISWEEYKELVYFCLQYDQKKREAAALLTVKLSTPPPEMYHVVRRVMLPDGQSVERITERGTFLPHGSGYVSDPTAATAAKRDKLLSQVRMIEKAVKAACDGEGEGIYPALLKAVTTRSGVQAVYADPNIRPPCNDKKFYFLRRKFFWILREMRNGGIEPI